MKFIMPHENNDAQQVRLGQCNFRHELNHLGMLAHGQFLLKFNLWVLGPQCCHQQGQVLSRMSPHAQKHGHYRDRHHAQAGEVGCRAGQIGFAQFQISATDLDLGGDGSNLVGDCLNGQSPKGVA